MSVRTRTARTSLLLTVAVGGSLLVPPAPAGAAATYPVISKASVTSTGQTSPNGVGERVLVDRTGRFVVFDTPGVFTAGDANQQTDVFVHDRLDGSTERVSVTDADQEVSGPSQLCGASRNGRFIGFTSEAENLPVPNTVEVYVRDLEAGTTTIVSVDSNEVPAPDDELEGIDQDEACPISDDGRFIAFTTDDGLVATDTDHDPDVYRRDQVLGTTSLMSVSAAGQNQPKAAREAALSADGSVVAFTSSSGALVPGDTNEDRDVFLRLTATSTTVRMSVKTAGGQVEGDADEPALSSDGTRVVFTSTATDLVAGDGNGQADVFVRNRSNGVVTQASLSDAEGEGSLWSEQGSVSDDGRYVVFSSGSPELEPGDAGSFTDAFRRDVLAGTTDRVSSTPAGAAGNHNSAATGISGDGSVVAFTSSASNLVRNDAPNVRDAFVRDDAEDLTPFVSMDSFVKQQHQDFAGRQPSAAELSAAKARLANGEVSPDAWIDELAHGSPWATKRAPLIRLYWAFFLRAPDQNGLGYWAAKLSSGTSLAKVAKQFAASSEFQTKYGSKTNGQFVTLIYQNIFDRDPDPGGLAYWTKKLDTKAKTHGDVMTNFSESSEGRRVLAPQTDTILIFLGMMRTMPSSTVLAEFRQSLGDGDPPETVAAWTRTLPAYVARFGA